MGAHNLHLTAIVYQHNVSDIVRDHFFKIGQYPIQYLVKIESTIQGRSTIYHGFVKLPLFLSRLLQSAFWM